MKESLQAIEKLFTIKLFTLSHKVIQEFKPSILNQKYLKSDFAIFKSLNIFKFKAQKN